MAMNSALFSHNSDEWETPQEIYDALDQEFNFDVDACASAVNHKCLNYYTIEQDGLKMNWGGAARLV